MPPVTPPAYTPLPTPVPQRDNPTNFATRADAFLAALPDYQTELDAIGDAAYDNAVDAQTNATAAAASAAAADAAKVAAQYAQQQAAQYAGAAMWVAATNYATGATVWSPTSGLTYRRKAPGGVDATDPANDTAGTKWTIALAAAPLYRPEATATATAQVNVEHGLRYAGAQNLDMPLPANLVQGDIIHARVENGRTDNYLTLHGAKVNGEVQSGDVLVLDDQYAAIQARWTGATYGWSI